MLLTLLTTKEENYYGNGSKKQHVRSVHPEHSEQEHQGTLQESAEGFFRYEDQ